MPKVFKHLSVLLLCLTFLVSCTEGLPRMGSLHEPYISFTIQEKTADSAYLLFFLSNEPGLIGLNEVYFMIEPMHGKREYKPFTGQFEDDAWKVSPQINDEIPSELLQTLHEDFGYTPGNSILAWARLTDLKPGEIYLVWAIANYGQDPVYSSELLDTPLFGAMQVTSTTWNGASFKAEVNTADKLARWFFKVSAMEKGEIWQEDISENIWITRYSLLNPFETSLQDVKASLQEGSITAEIKDLNPGARYSVRAYKEWNGTGFSSDAIEFRTENVTLPEVPQLTDLTSSTATILFQMPSEASGTPGIELEKDDGDEYTEMSAPSPQWDERTGAYTIQLKKLSSRFSYHIRTYYLKDGTRILSDKLNFRPFDK